MERKSIPTELKDFLLAEASINLKYKKFEITTGLKSEQTSRDGEAYETIDLKSMLFDFGLDFHLSENIHSGEKYTRIKNFRLTTKH